MHKPWRIIHLIARLDGYGGARMLRNLAAGQASAGHDVIVAAGAAMRAIVGELELAGVRAHELHNRWAFDPIAIMRMARLQRESPPDVVHAWDAASLARGMAARGMAIRGLRRSPPILATWDATQCHRVGSGQIVRSAQARDAAFVVEDERTRARLLAQGVKPRLITLISPGAAWPAPPISREAAFAELGLERNALWIAVAGPLSCSKRIDDVIWCFELVRVLHPQVRLVVFGDGPDRERLERYASLVSEPDCVRFAGFRADFTSLVRHATLYLQLDAPCATPRALLEAMAAGVPVVASDMPAYRAVISPGESGFLVKLGDRADAARAAVALCGDDALARRLGANAQAAATKAWALEPSLRAYAARYRSILENAGA